MSIAPVGRSPEETSWLRLPQPVPRRWLLLALLGVLLLARQPDDILRPQFQAEEGTIFFRQAYNEGFWSSLLAPTSGYIHLALRLTAGLALLAPLELAPLVFKLAAFAIQMLPVAYLLADDVPGFVVTPAFRVLAAVIYVAGPNSVAPFLNVLNSQWHLTFAACLILLAGPRPGRSNRALDAGVLLLFATSGPFSLVCLPLALWSWLRARRERAGAVPSLGPLIVALGAALQLAFLLAGTRLTGGAAGFAAPSPAEIVRIIGLHGVCNSLLGAEFTARNHQAFPPGTALAAAALIPVLALAALRLRNLALLALFGLASVSMAVLFLFPVNEPRNWLDPGYGNRYFFFAMLFVLLTLLAMAERGGRWRLFAFPGLAVALLLGVRGDYPIAAHPNVHWPDQIAVFKSLPPGTDFFLPAAPQHSFWGLTLRRRGPASGTDVLARYPVSGKPLAAHLETIVTTIGPGFGPGEHVVVFTGFAVDAARGQPAGGVFLQVGARLFPAVTGPVPPSAAISPAQAEAGFTRCVPADGIGPGSHRVRLLALDHAGKALLATGPTNDFVIW